MKYNFKSITAEENEKVDELRKITDLSDIKQSVKKLSLLEKLALFAELDNDGSAVALSHFSKRTEL